MKLEGEAFRLFIGGSTAGNSCSMQGGKFENKILKLFIGGNTAGNACSIQEDKNGNRFLPASCVGQYKKK